MNPAVEARKRVLILGELDGYANGLKPVEIERFLRSRATTCGWSTPCCWAAPRTSPALCSESCPRCAPDALFCTSCNSRHGCSLVAGASGGAISRTT